MKFLLTIDTEGDNQWDHGRDLTVENIRYVPRFQELCDKYGIKPTYFVTSEICDDSFSREIFTRYITEGRAEIGTHLHAWTTPPFSERDGYRFNDPYHGFATEFPENILRHKVLNLTNQIGKSFGKRPVSFRSGRFGFNEDLAGILSENSYIVDSSVTPYINWSEQKGIPGGNGAPDFIGKTAFPYMYNFAKGSLLEIPVTILPTKFPLNKSDRLADYYFKHAGSNLFLRVLRKIFFANQPLWHRPHGRMNMELFRELIDEAEKIKLPYLVMMFHSSELMPGSSIYRKDIASVEQLYSLLESLFIYLENKKTGSLTMTGAAHIVNL